MRKTLSLLVVVAMVASLLVGFSPATTKAENKIINPIVQMKLDYTSKNLNVSPPSKKALEQALPYVEIDGVSLPKSLVELKKIKDGTSVIKVAIDGANKTALDYAKENNININSSNVSPIDKAKVVSYIDVLKAEHNSIKSQLIGLPVTVKKDLYIAYNGVIVETQVKYVKDLIAKFGKGKVHVETIYTTDLNYSVPLIGAGPNGVWTDPGVDGTGMVVGVVDTGVDYTHPDLGGGWGNKVVAGYDFGDDDTDPMDCNGHGTHVAGIMAADGLIKGVAPKAKIVAAKIVKGCEGSASSFDIADAFDYMADPLNLDNGPEGTHPPVQAVNMSFGSQAGFVTTDEPEQAAIERCVQSGIFVSISAGNSYWSYYPYGYYPMFPDFAIVGSPSVTPSAMSVAASYNSYSKYPALTRIAPAPQVNYAYTVGSTSPDPITTLGDNNGEGYEYVYCGLGGSPSDFPSSVAGRIALIQRGTYPFTTKITNAYNAGAIGVIIFNNTTGYITMDTTGAPNIPSVFISQADGIALKPYAVNGTTGGGKVGFRPNIFVDVPQATDTMVDFSSWGPPPDLSFKPEITAPGGGIWSTVPVAQGSYANYSGTSMASPHVGAVGALVKEAHPDWSPAQIKIALMSTAKILMSGSLPYSVLKQGAGRVDVYNALHNNVLLTDASKGTPYVALGELPSYKTSPIVFSVRLTNYGSTDVTYNISATLQSIRSNLNPMALNGATISTIPSGTITVPAGGSADVVVMIDATQVPDWNLTGSYWGWPFIEGFVKFIPQNAAQPGPGGNIPGEIHIPYMGFLGKWNQFTNEDGWDFNPLVDPPADDPASVSKYLLGSKYGATWPELTDEVDWYYAGVDFYGNLDRNAIAFNPDGLLPLLETDFWALRNIQNVKIEIRDQNNNLIKTIDSTDYIYKMIPSYGVGWYSHDIYDDDWWVWNGTDSSGNPVPDGKYKLVITATAPKIFNKLTYDPPQVIEFPVSVDRVNPEVHITSIVDNGNGTYTINWSQATDQAPSSGIWGYVLFIDGDYNHPKWIAPTQTSYTISGLTAGSHSFELGVFDNANNYGYDEKIYNVYTITPSVNNPSWGTIIPSTPTLVGEGANKSFTITANLGYHIADIKVDGLSIFAPEGGKPKPSIEGVPYTYTFENVTSNHTIQAVFAPGVLQYVITASATSGGTITPSGNVFVPQFGSQTFTITPDPHYHIKDVLVDGNSVGPVPSYTFENINDNHTIEAYFEH
ncbi:MAG: S8 family serine peptidase, partial [Nitrososphaeria archaeon]